MKAVIYNNSAFGLIPLEAESIGLAPFREGIEFPNPDFAALARACGGHGFKVTKPDELKDTINEAFMVDGPAIVDAVVETNQAPRTQAPRTATRLPIENRAAKSLPMPALALGGEKGVGTALHDALQGHADQLEGGQVEGHGQYLPEECPDELARRILRCAPGVQVAA